ncbi:hypothetical protein Tco_1100008 [Tanacetum coccineum]
MVESLFSKFRDDKVRMLSVHDHKGMLQVKGKYIRSSKAQTEGKELDEEQLAFLADPGVADEVLMANLSSCNSDVLFDVPYSDNSHNDMMNQVYAIDHWIKPTLYDVNVLSKTHDVIFMVDDEETLILAEESRSKMVEKQNDPIMKKEKINITPINYSKLNKLAKDFGKRCVPQQELFVEQKFWLQGSDKNYEEPSTSITLVKITVPSELPKLNKLKDFFKEFDKGLHNEISEVQAVFIQMEATVEQCSNDKSVDTCNKCLELEAELVKKNDAYIELSKRFSHLEQHCISLEVTMQLNQEIFQKDKSCVNQNDPVIQEYFEQNDLRAQLQAKDTIISKLKETIHSLRENANPDKVKKDIDEIETINIELEHSVAKLLSENEKLHKEKEHLKQTYNELYDLIKPTRVRAKEQCEALIVNPNSKSVENEDLKAQIQEKIFANAALKNELRKLKGKNMLNTAVSKPNATTIALGMYKLDIEPISHRLKNNRDAHEDYLKKTIENTNTIRGLVERARK